MSTQSQHSLFTYIVPIFVLRTTEHANRYRQRQGQIDSEKDGDRQTARELNG